MRQLILQYDPGCRGLSMKEFTYVVTDPVGIHARPAGIMVKEIKGLDSTVTIEKVATGKSALGTKLRNH